MNKAYTKIIAFCFLSALLSACMSVGPDYQRPSHIPFDHRTDYVNAPIAREDDNNNKEQDVRNEPNDKALEIAPVDYASENWWADLNDPILSDMVAKLKRDNLSLKQAGQRIHQMRAIVAQQRGGFAPNLALDSNASRGFSPNALTNERQYSNSFDLGLSTSWQLDLYGRIARSVESAQSNLDASLYDRQALLHSLIAELIRRRVAIATNQNLSDLARQNADNRKSIFDITERRYNLGVSNTKLSDVLLAEENYKSVTSDEIAFQRALQDELYALDVLLGQRPGATDITHSEFSMMPNLPAVKTCMPLSLLDRRPDLRANELRLQAATADIGVAIADLYPSLSLGGSIGFQDNELSDLITADRLVGSILASLTAPIFQGGQIRANIALQKAEMQELAYAYAENILTAIREVESALQADQKLTLEINSLDDALTSLRQAENTAQERYIAGLSPLREVLDIQQRRYQLEQNLISKQQQKWLARIALHLALGGHWDTKKDTDNMSFDQHRGATCP